MQVYSKSTTAGLNQKTLAKFKYLIKTITSFISTGVIKIS